MFHLNLRFLIIPHCRSSDRVVEAALNYFYQYFFSLEDVPSRTKKHIASPQKNSTCKRLEYVFAMDGSRG